MAERSLEQLLHAYRGGDPAAQNELLTRLEGQLRALVRALVGRQIRTERQSLDICQSLLLAFHLQAMEGKLAFDSEEAFRAYLRTMIRHKLANLSDRLRAVKRGEGKRPVALTGSDDEEIPLPSFDPSASVVASTAELRTRIEEHLAGDESRILEGLLAGRTYAEIAAELGKTADAVRMTWNRARARLESRGVLGGGQ